MDNAAISLAYRRGTELDVMPIRPIPEHCIEVPAGPVRFVIETRDVSADLELMGRPSARTEDGTPPLQGDGGASLHVFSTADNVERLRFDCFEAEPHYHYVKYAPDRNHVVRIDEVAEGDPVTWTIDRMRSRLPEMLEYAESTPTAAAVRADADAVAAAVEKVAELLGRAQEQSQQQRHG
jgi:hypothetical protein